MTRAPGTRAPSFAEHALRHRWKGVLLLTALAGVPLTWLISTVPQTTYRVTQGYVVADVAEDGDRAVTANSDRAARDYAAVLRTDDALVDEVADEVDVPADDVADRLSAGYLPGAGTLFVRYDAEDRREVLDVMAALDRILTSQGAPAGGMAPGDVTPLGVPPVEQLGLPVDDIPGAGFVAALLGAAAGAVLLERLRPRVVDATQVRAATDTAVVSLDGPDALELLAFRLSSSAPDRVLVRAVPGVENDAAQRLAYALVARGVPAQVADPLSSGPASWVLLAELPGSQREVEDAIQACGSAADVVVAVRSAVPVGAGA